MSTGKVLASTSTADSARSLARILIQRREGEAAPADRGRVSGEENRPGGFFSVRHGFSFSLSASNSSEFILQREHVADVREVYPVSPDISIEGTRRNVRGILRGHHRCARASESGDGNVPVTPTFKLPAVHFSTRLPSTKNRLLPQNARLSDRGAPPARRDAHTRRAESSLAVLLLISRPGFKPVPGDALLVSTSRTILSRAGHWRLPGDTRWCPCATP